MFKRSLNRAVIRVTLTTRSPLLIRAGDTGLDPSQSDLACVRTRYTPFSDRNVDPNGGLTVYIPGASLKGVVRSATEALVRGREIRGLKAKEAACDPLDQKHSCNQHANARGESAAIHAQHCLACRTYGSTAMRGRAAVRDLYPFEAGATTPSANYLRANQVEVRNGVGIDRVAGSVRRGVLYDMEMVPTGSRFHGEIAVVNYQAWQLGFLAAALQELDDGFAQLGSTKTRGFGVVSAQVDEVVIEQTARVGRPVDVATLVSDGERRTYNLLDAGELLSPVDGEATRRGLNERFTFSGDRARALMVQAESALGALL